MQKKKKKQNPKQIKTNTQSQNPPMNKPRIERKKENDGYSKTTHPAF